MVLRRLDRVALDLVLVMSNGYHLDAPDMGRELECHRVRAKNQIAAHHRHPAENDVSRNSPACAYQAAGILDQAIPLFEAILADSERATIRRPRVARSWRRQRWWADLAAHLKKVVQSLGDR
jgi:hypothetical protein